MASLTYNPTSMASPQTRIPPMPNSHGGASTLPSQSQQQSQGQKPRQSDRASRTRLLTVDEALQYSPLSSIVPFSTNVIGTPSANFSSPQPIFPSPLDASKARQPMDLLNQDVLQYHGQSSLSQKAMKDLKSYIDTGSSTELKFKTPFNSNHLVPGQAADSNINSPRLSDRLTPFAKMVLDGTDLSHRYPTPSSSESPSPPKGNNTTADPKTTVKGMNSLRAPYAKSPIAPFLPTPAAENHHSFAYNAQLPLSRSKSTTINSSPVSPDHQTTKVAVVVPPLSAEARSSEYIMVVDKSPMMTVDASPRGRKTSQNVEARDTAQAKDQRAIAEEASQLLQDLIQDIFEAEEEMQANSSQDVPSGAAPFFVSPHCQHTESSVLSHAVQVKLELSLQKAIQHRRLCDLPIAHLSRLQTLCETSIFAAENSELATEASWNEEDLSQWIHRLEDVDLGLRSARTVLRIMTGGREEKEIYSEELLQKILRLITNVVQSCLIPIVEARNTEPTLELFRSVQPHKKEISQLLYNVGKLMNLLCELLTKIDMAESIVNAVEFFATNVLFVENSYNEKDSLLGVQRFEMLRRTAMDMISGIFSRYPEQRASIFDEVLTSLQKLPTTRQHARQFKLTAGVNIQLVSALIMRLVQTSAKKTASESSVPRDRVHAGSSASNNIGHSDDNTDAEESSDQESDDGPKAQCDKMLRRLSREASSLSDSASKSAQYVIRFFVSRAMTTPKSGDQPHRHLLDIFSEDLIAVLSQPEWPAAELLLRALLVNVIEVAENPKYNAPAKNMALELLGLMGSAISDLVSSTRQAAKGLESDDCEFSVYLRQLLDDYMDGALDSNELLGWGGPYRAVIEYLQSNEADEASSRSAQAYYLAQWARAVAGGNLESCTRTEKLAANLSRSLSRSALDTPDRLEATSSSQSHLAYTLTVLSMDFCRQFDRVLKILLDSISSEQITVRTRSLKSVTQMLEKDPSLLDRARNVKNLIMRCATDRSSSVRDSALMLIGRCIALKPALEQEFCKPLLAATNDTATGVRKRAMKLLKDIYLRNVQKETRSAISDSLLQRAKDFDKGVADLARQIIEEIWLMPFWGLSEAPGEDVKKKVAFQKEVALIVHTVQRGDSISSVLTSFLQELLVKEAKNSAVNSNVCKMIVATAFESMMDTDNTQDRPGQCNVLQTLTVFAKACPQLFTSDQLKYLQPYIANLSSTDDLHLFRSAVVVFRCVLPTMSAIQHQLLRDVQSALLASLSKLGTIELDEVCACLSTINETLGTPGKLVKPMLSVLQNLQNFRKITFSDTNRKEDVIRAKKFVRIAGYMGKHCNLEDQQQAFRESLTWWKGTSVAGLIINSIYPFTDAAQPLALRADAFNSIGLICQSQPDQFKPVNISSGFEQVLIGGEPKLQNIVLSVFRDFFAKQEKQSEVKSEETAQDSKGLAIGKLGASMTATDSDGASALIAQRFLKIVLRIALASQDTSALTATEVIASINRQGLVHPKESGPALAALETSTDPAIANVAFQAHKNLHQQHESMFEREYMRAVDEAFKYQKNVVQEPLGYTKSPYASKLRSMFDIINTSKGKYVKKFLSGFCAKIDFEPSKLDVEGTPPAPLQHARFLIENLAFFEYGRIDDLLHTITCIEKIVSGTGSGIAHSINTEVYQVKVDSILEGPGEGLPEAERSADAVTSIDHSRLRQLTTGAIILSSLWEARTFLRRLYGLQANQQRRDSKLKAVAKDLNKVPTKAPGITGERLIKAITGKVDSLGNRKSMLSQCQEFVELLSVDSEVKVASEGEDGVEGPGTPSEEDGDTTPVPGSAGSRALKRKGSASTNGTPQKRKRGRPSIKRRKTGEEDSD